MIETSGSLYEVGLANAFVTALELATFRRFGLDRRFMQPWFVTTDESNQTIHEQPLPGLPAFTSTASDKIVPFKFGVYTWADQYWAERHTDTTWEQSLHEGVSILGALAMLPPGTALAYRDKAGAAYGIKPRLHLNGTEPFLQTV